MARILIVDDDKDIILLLEELLTMQGHEIVAKAYDGEQAVKIIEKFQVPPDIILMDHRMPRKNGLITTKEILSIYPDCNIIFISADFSIKTQALKTGAISFIEKPISFSDLFSTIDLIMSNKEKSSRRELTIF